MQQCSTISARASELAISSVKSFKDCTPRQNQIIPRLQCLLDSAKKKEDNITRDQQGKVIQLSYEVERLCGEDCELGELYDTITKLEKEVDSFAFK